jgi:hypothetical protein
MSPVLVTTPSSRPPYLVGSMREFGGELAGAPIWVFGDSSGFAGVEEIPINAPVRQFSFAGKLEQVKQLFLCHGFPAARHHPSAI